MKARRHVIRWFLLIATIFALLVSGVSITTAQCVIRSDWPVYTVQRGDTLARIAQRYSTTFSTLATANCLSDPNRIFAGQQLRVPPTGGIVITPPPVIYPSDVAVTYQPFERGFMTWKAGTGEITVFFATGGAIANGGTLRIFAAASYGRLPDNPGPVVPPAGLVSPTFGFGRVWANFTEVRQALGWATAAETGYLMRVYPPNSATYQFSLPDGRVIYVNNNQTWSFSSGFPTVVPPTPIVTPGPVVTTTSAAYQPYQNGFMIWEANTQNVVAFYNTGRYEVFRVRDYGPLPDNPVLDPTPPGLVRPAFGFGRVWGNYTSARQTLGWATAGETGYTASFRSSPSGAGYPQTCFALPNAQLISYALSNGIRFWNFVSACPG